jgi:hypothetical protein
VTRDPSPAECGEFVWRSVPSTHTHPEDLPIYSKRRHAITAAVLLAFVMLLATGLAMPGTAAASAANAHARISYRLPFVGGQRFRVTQGWNTTFSHNGKAAFAYDFGMPEGTPIVASAAGQVAYTHDGETVCGGPKLINYANYVVIYHADGSATQYGHLSRVDVAVGDLIAAGQPIGLSGKTGYTNCQPHLHFARQAQGRAISQSRPIYFAEYPWRQLYAGAWVESRRPACAQASSGLPLNAFCGVYFDDSLAGPVSISRKDRAINFDWPGTASKTSVQPFAPTGAAGFAVRWVGRFSLPLTGTFAFALQASGGVRLIIDGKTVLDAWNHPTATASGILVSRSLTAGSHLIELDFQTKVGHAAVHLAWSRSLESENIR